jgi:hypothetical protein
MANLSNLSYFSILFSKVVFLPYWRPKFSLLYHCTNVKIPEYACKINAEYFVEAVV